MSKPDKKTKKKAETVFVLRMCAADLSSYNGFKWPKAGPVKCKDWSPIAECGGGLHGWLNGEGDAKASSYFGDPGAKWLVVEVAKKAIVDLRGKVKFPSGRVVHCGDRFSATAFLAERVGARAIIGGTATAGYGGTATAGYGGTATAGDRGTATAGECGTATAGECGEVRIKYYDGAAGRYRTAIGYIGEGGLEPRKKYRLDGSKFVEVKA